MLSGAHNAYGTLFRANIKPLTPKEEIRVEVAVADSSMLQLYHERWGHQDKLHVKEMLEKELGIKVKLEKELCEPCIYGKTHRLPFGTRRKTTELGELISTDVCGPFDESFRKKRYLVVFKDSYTKYRYGFVVREKSNVKTVLQQMVAHAKQHGHSVKELLSDNGGEFDNEEVRKILHKNGITQRLTAPYTPEQNGGSERENRTIIEMARTFKYSNKEVRFPEAIWAELVTSAVYVLNRTGKSSVNDTSPYELWIGRKPRLKHLRIIGSSCYVHIPKQKRRKMDKKAIKGYLVGYDSDERYRVYIEGEHKVVVSRDIKFQESLKECEEKVQLPLQDIGIEQEEPEESTDSSMKTDKTSDEEHTDTEIEEESQQPSSTRRLRDRSTLKKPEHLDDYVMITEDLVNGSEHLDGYVMIAEDLADKTEYPETFEEAVSSKNHTEWKKAMNSEIASLEENRTWDLVNLPQDAKAIPCKWVFRLKTNPDGTIDKYKARLVIKGFSQRRGIDYNQTFSPVARMGTIRSVLSIVASEQMHLTQFDVSTAFLYGKLEETIYMQQPTGYSDGTDKVCLLRKSLYGLKQAPRCWFECFGRFLLKQGFRASDADPCLYFRERNGKKLILVLYVDDGLVGATDPCELDAFLEELRTEFKITSKKTKFFLGLQIEQKNGSIRISQGAFAKEFWNASTFWSVDRCLHQCSRVKGLQKQGKKAFRSPAFLIDRRLVP